MYALDTNILVRYITQDDLKQAHKAVKVIESLSTSNLAFISCIVLCEVNWVLQSRYKVPKQDRLTVLQKILTTDVFEIENLDACLKALKNYKNGRADFPDYLIQQIAIKNGCESVLTFDKLALKNTGFQSP